MVVLRKKARMTQTDFGQAARVDQSDMSHYEQGKSAPSEPALRRMANVANVPWPVVVHLRRFIAAVLEAADRGSAAGADPRFERAVLDTALLSVMPYLVEEQTEPDGPSLEEDLQEAEEIWAALERYPAAERQRRLDTAPRDACRSWAALAKRVSLGKPHSGL